MLCSYCFLPVYSLAASVVYFGGTKGGLLPGTDVQVRGLSNDGSSVVGSLDPDELRVNELLDTVMRDKGVPLEVLKPEGMISPGRSVYVSDDASIFASGSVDWTGAAPLDYFWYAEIPSIPEPSTVGLLSVGLFCLVAGKTRRKATCSVILCAAVQHGQWSCLCRSAHWRRCSQYCRDPSFSNRIEAGQSADPRG